MGGWLKKALSLDLLNFTYALDCGIRSGKHYVLLSMFLIPEYSSETFAVVLDDRKGSISF